MCCIMERRPLAANMSEERNRAFPIVMHEHIHESGQMGGLAQVSRGASRQCSIKMSKSYAEIFSKFLRCLPHCPRFSHDNFFPLKFSGGNTRDGTAGGYP